MKMSTKLGILSLILGASLSFAGAEEVKPPNVLLIAVDDLNDWVGCLGGHPDTRTPNIDRLAKRGVLFSNAHCQSTMCNPSRTSIMFGMRPSTTGFYDNLANGAKSGAFTSKHVSMPRHFAAGGYKTLTTGKIYHGSVLPPNDFEVVGPLPGQKNPRDKVVQKTRPSAMHKAYDFGPQSYEEKYFNDYVVASWAIERLSEKHERPFFMALGFYRPHAPFFAPERIHNSRDLLDGFALPTVKDDDWADLPDAAEELAMKTWSFLPPHSWMQKNNNAKWKEFVHAYLACIRWTDEQLGRVLDALDASPHADNTIIVLYSDHGFHLGEKSRWSKFSLWERSTRVPMIISTPGGLKGRRCARTVELLSIYPTLVELCSLGDGPDSLEGVSLKPLLNNLEAPWDHPAVTTLLPNNHTVRTERWRYIRYADGSEELYDHEIDPHEWTNLANDPGSKETLTRLKTHLPKTNARQVPGKSRQLDRYRGTNGGNKPGQAEGALPLNQVEVSMHMVFPVKSEGKYYTTGTTVLLTVRRGKTAGFPVYSSRDLKTWDKQLAWAPPAGSEWDSKAWGAIIHPLKDKYIMVGAVYSTKKKKQGIFTMESDKPQGPYNLRSEEPLMDGIDPHITTDKDGSPWLVVGGAKGIKAAPLSNDLRRILAEPKTILHASKVPGAERKKLWINDAPVFHRLRNGELLMLFSSFHKYEDGIGHATYKLRSKTGDLLGPWESEGVFLPKQHGASFWRRFDGELMATVKPFGVAVEDGRPEFILLKETSDDVFLHPDGSAE